MPELHVQILAALKSRVSARQRQHESRAGLGLEDREYQRMVGRIAETKVLVEEIDRLMKAGLEELEDLENELEQTQRRTPSTRKPKRG